MIYIGIDPDTNATGVAILDRNEWSLYSMRAGKGEIEDRIVEVARELYGFFSTIWFSDRIVAAVEWPMVYPRIKARPNDILSVATVAGAAVGAVAQMGCDVQIVLPRPQAWKGTVPKEVAQARYLDQSGLVLGSPEFADIPEKYKTHVVDAIGLALWAKRTHPA